MGYLDQLKNISNVPDAGPKKPNKPQESGFLGFLGSSYGVLEKTQALDAYPSALAAEPVEPGRRQPDVLLTGDQEAAVLAWLSEIGETDPAIIAEVLTGCRRNADAREYFAGRAGANLVDVDDDRRRCDECGNLRGGACIVAKPSGRVSAVRGYRPAPDIPHRCAAFGECRQLGVEATGRRPFATGPYDGLDGPSPIEISER